MPKNLTPEQQRKIYIDSFLKQLNDSSDKILCTITLNANAMLGVFKAEGIEDMELLQILEDAIDTIKQGIANKN